MGRTPPTGICIWRGSISLVFEPCFCMHRLPYVSRTERNLQNVHGMHQLFTGETLIRGWFLLMNGLFLFKSGNWLGFSHWIAQMCINSRTHSPPSAILWRGTVLSQRIWFESWSGARLTFMTVPPTRLIALIHPQLMMRLISQIDDEAIPRLKFYTRYSLADSPSQPNGDPTLKRGIIDTHFHLHKLSIKRCMPLSDLESSNSPSIRLPFVIANNVFPSRWYLLGDRVRADPRLKFTFGVHPHLISSLVQRSTLCIAGWRKYCKSI